MKLGLKVIFLLMAIIACKGLWAQDNVTYKQLIEEADLYLKVGDVAFARLDYQKAVTLNPSDEYPRLKLAEIDRKATAQHQTDSLFEASLVNAEKYFQSGSYSLAQIEYKHSLELKPESEFIRERLAAISTLLPGTGVPVPESDKANPNKEVAKPEIAPPVSKANPVKSETAKQKSNTNQAINAPVNKPVSEPVPATPTPLQTALSQAEEFMAAQDYDNASQRYQAALVLKPNDKSIKTKLVNSLSLLDKQKKNQKTYNDLLLAAEKAVTLKNIQQAVTYYEQATLLKPDDAVVTNRLASLRDELKVEQGIEKDFKEIITRADQFLHDNNLAEARKSYEQARNLKPDDKYPQEKLLEISKIEAIAESENLKKYKETLVLAESLLNQEDYQGAYQTFSKASEIEPGESYPKQKMTELNAKIKELEAQYKVEYDGDITEADKAYKAKNWDIAMDDYLKASKAKIGDTLSGNQMKRIVNYMDHKLILTLAPSSPLVSEGKEVKLPFKAIENPKRANHYFVLRVRNSAAGAPRLYINYGQDSQKNGGIIYRNFLKGGQYLDYVIKVVNQDRWYRFDNNWISFTVEGGSLEIESLKICADI
ncbi:MAG: hypothetical protein Q8908_05550 [Bacteroidota bacterium]|nr:hypothetical protein [Bacteroidota bacterium]